MHIYTYVYIYIYIYTYVHTHMYENQDGRTCSLLGTSSFVWIVVAYFQYKDLQHTATHCNTLQPSAILYIALQQHAYSLDVSPVY